MLKNFVLTLFLCVCVVCLCCVCVKKLRKISAVEKQKTEQAGTSDMTTIGYYLGGGDA